MKMKREFEKGEGKKEMRMSDTGEVMTISTTSNLCLRRRTISSQHSVTHSLTFLFSLFIISFIILNFIFNLFFLIPFIIHPFIIQVVCITFPISLSLHVMSSFVSSFHVFSFLIHPCSLPCCFIRYQTSIFLHLNFIISLTISTYSVILTSFLILRLCIIYQIM